MVAGQSSKRGMLMHFDVLPTRLDSAAANMAADLLLLQRYPQDDRVRFRHYGWHRPALTFGFSQKIEWVRRELPSDDPVELCRRPTGGGIVDHRDDWTYALVLPRQHPVYALRAVESYRLVHEALAQALREHGAKVEVKTHCEADACEGGGYCFRRAELFDVVRSGDGAKVAGAAQKRTKRGLLFQGSIWRPTLSDLPWEEWGATFVQRLGETVQAAVQDAPWPDFDEEHMALTEVYAGSQWNEQR